MASQGGFLLCLFLEQSTNAGLVLLNRISIYPPDVVGTAVVLHLRVGGQSNEPVTVRESNYCQLTEIQRIGWL